MLISHTIVLAVCLAREAHKKQARRCARPQGELDPGLCLCASALYLSINLSVYLYLPVPSLRIKLVAGLDPKESLTQVRCQGRGLVLSTLRERARAHTHTNTLLLEQELKKEIAKLRRHNAHLQKNLHYTMATATRASLSLPGASQALREHEHIEPEQDLEHVHEYEGERRAPALVGALSRDLDLRDEARNGAAPRHGRYGDEQLGGEPSRACGLMGQIPVRADGHHCPEKGAGGGGGGDDDDGGGGCMRTNLLARHGMCFQSTGGGGKKGKSVGCMTPLRRMRRGAAVTAAVTVAVGLWMGGGRAVDGRWRQRETRG